MNRAGIVLALSLWPLIATGQWAYLGLPDQEITSMVVIEGDSLVLLAGTVYYYGIPERGGIFRSTDNGTTWDRVAVPQRCVWHILTSPLLRGTILAATSAGLLRSHDTGLTWDTVTTHGADCPICHQWRVAVNPLDSLDWFIGSGTIEGEDRIYRSRDGGETWNFFWTGPLMCYRGLLFSNILDGILYGLSPNVIYRFNVQDSTRELIRFTYTGHGGGAIHPSQPYLCVGTDDTLMRFHEISGEWSYLVGPDHYFPYDVLYTGPQLDGWLHGTRAGIYLVDSPFTTAELLEENAPLLGGSPLAISSWGDLYATYGAIYLWHLFSDVGDFRDIQPVLRKPVVFPNPVRSMIHWQIQGPAEIRVYNILGRLVWSERYIQHGSQEVSFQTNSLANGPYYYTIHHPGKSSVARQSGSFRVIR